MVNDIKISEAKLEDAPIVAWTVLEALDNGTENMKKFIDSCSDEKSLYSWKNSFVAFANEKAVGCLIAYDGLGYKVMRKYTWMTLWNEENVNDIENTEDETKAGEFYLDSMAIIPEYRGYGIGKMLIEIALEKGKRCGCDCATLLVDVCKPRLKSYYEEIGFEKINKMFFLGHNYYKMKYEYK